MIFTLSGSIFLILNTPVWEQNCKKPHPVWEQRIKKIHCSPVWEQKFEKSIPFWSIFAENDTRLGSKNGENYTLSSGTYPVPKTSKCPPGIPAFHLIPVFYIPRFQDSQPHATYQLKIFKINERWRVASSFVYYLQLEYINEAVECALNVNTNC